jgi:hypothetical protein
VGADLGIPTVQGERSARVRLINAYMRALFRAAERDGKVARAFREVTHMLKVPPTLFAPNVVARVAWGNLRRKLFGGGWEAGSRQAAETISAGQSPAVRSRNSMGAIS